MLIRQQIFSLVSFCCKRWFSGFSVMLNVLKNYFGGADCYVRNLHRDGVIFVDNDSDNRTIFSANCYLWLP